METTTTLYIDARNPGIMQTIYAVQYDSGRLLRCIVVVKHFCNTYG